MGVDTVCMGIALASIDVDTVCMGVALANMGVGDVSHLKTHLPPFIYAAYSLILRPSVNKMTSELTGKELGLLGSLILASKFLPSKTVLVDEVELASSQVSTVSGTKTSSVQTTIGQSIKLLRQELGIQGVFAWNTELARAYESKLARLVGISSQAFADAFVQSGLTTHPSIADIVAQLHNRAN